MRSPAESRCCGATSRGRDEMTGPQALRWRRVVTDGGLMTLGCQRRRAGSAVAAAWGLQDRLTSMGSTASGQAASRFQGSSVSLQGHRILTQ
ncbi:hypothetical protein NDU88_000707 [Pleurodeles waltl]|uniref:Uncharacterized protein n=1 Tax=Pleurodeles waltl TaxID=8319 RepID=A0AAV7L7M6_PLEWA|nr:hypothetical protein NDU88_000707 [Pleurodeles waltl]